MPRWASLCFVIPRPPTSTLFPYTTLFRSHLVAEPAVQRPLRRGVELPESPDAHARGGQVRSEEHTSELQSLRHLVCRLLLEKKNAPRSPKQASQKAHIGRVGMWPAGSSTK